MSDADALSEDVIVYDDHDHYVANFTDQGWLRWPAEQHGWSRRQPVAASVAEDRVELAPRLARLALRLSGVRERETLA
jgi:hypothetical protein